MCVNMRLFCCYVENYAKAVMEGKVEKKSMYKN